LLQEYVLFLEWMFYEFGVWLDELSGER
jgi:hypothetical protein